MKYVSILYYLNQYGYFYIIHVLMFNGRGRGATAPFTTFEDTYGIDKNICLQ